MPPKGYIAADGATELTTVELANGKTTAIGSLTHHTAAERIAKLLLSNTEDGAASEPPPDETVEPEETKEPQPEDTPAEEPEPEAATTEEEPGDPDAEATPAKQLETGPEDEVVFNLDDGSPVTRAEAKRGHLRQKDYTRKTQETAELRKTLETEIEGQRNARTNYAQGLEEVKKAIQRVIPQEPNWDQLQRENPERYPIVWAQWHQLQEELKAMDSEAAELSTAAERDQLLQLEKFVKDEAQKLNESIPEWSDTKKQRTERQALLAYARSRGFSEQELNLFSMSKLMLLLRTAMKAEQKPQPKPGVPATAARPKVKPVAPGPNRLPAQKKDALNETRTTLKRTGRVDDAIRHVQQLLEKGR